MYLQIFFIEQGFYFEKDRKGVLIVFIIFFTVNIPKRRFLYLFYKPEKKLLLTWTYSPLCLQNNKYHLSGPRKEQKVAVINANISFKSQSYRDFDAFCLRLECTFLQFCLLNLFFKFYTVYIIKQIGHVIFKFIFIYIFY